MHPLDFLWIFFILVSLQPALQKRLLQGARRRLIARIEADRKSRVILLMHRQETLSFLGLPFMRYIDINDSEEVLRVLDATPPEMPVDVVLHTPGGLVLASTQIARALHQRQGKTTVFVPHHAMSGGTMIALAADEIVMTSHAVLGPVDPQLGQCPAASLLRVVQQKPIAEISDQTLILADQAHKAIEQVRFTIHELLADKLPAEKANELAEMLSEGRWTHDFAITADVAKQFGLSVSTEMPPDIMLMMELYPQPMQTQPTVEHLPTPHQTQPDRPAQRRP